MSIDLGRDLPTTPDDVAALRRAGGGAALGLEGYLDFLSRLPAPDVAALRARPVPRGAAPFRLTG